MAKKMVQQHQPIRDPNGWNENDRTLVIQLEEVLDDIYRHFGRLTIDDLSEKLREYIDGKAEKSDAVTAVTYDGTNKKLTKTINGATTDVVTTATIKSDILPLTWGDLAGQ